MGIFFLLAFIVLLLPGCSAALKDAAFPEAYDEAPAMSPAERGMDVEEDSNRAGEVEAAPGSRYMIRNAHLTLEIQDIEEAVQELQAGTQRMNGYVSSLDIQRLSDERRVGSITLRIPEGRFDQAMEMIKALGSIRNGQFDTADVTRQYIDMESRIANLEVQEQRLRELLDRAETVEDILKVEAELGRVRGNLEAMQGDFQHLQERVRYSTFQVRLVERDPRTQVVVDGGVSWEQVGELFILNTNRLVQGVLGFFVWFIGSLPILIPLLILVILAWKLTFSRRKRKRKKQEQQQEG